MAGTSKLTAVALAAVGVFGALAALRAAGSPIAPRVVHASAVAALSLALAAAFRTIASAWRGPVLVDFSREAAVECDAVESAGVRAAAQLRGTLGGAGHVHPGRLAFPALAWMAAAVIAACALREPPLAPGWAVSGLLFALAAAAVFPATPFWYREAHGGLVLLSPPVALAGLVRRSRSGGRAATSALPAPAGWGTSPTATDSGAKPADVHAAGYAHNRP